MSCCPPSPITTKITDFTSGDRTSSDKNSTEPRPNEPMECYSARVGNPTGQNDDATDYPKNKINNSMIAVSRNGNNVSINETFKLTPDSDAVATSWEYSPTINGIVFSGNVLSGQFPPSEIGKTHKLQVNAKDSAGQIIDTRAFTVTPTITSSNDTLRLVSPLPGGIINSPYGMRLHPKYKVMKMHNGIDMKMANRSVVDVVAAADGEVIFTGTLGGYGKHVKVKHSDSAGKTIAITTYSHLNDIYVSSGQKLMAGQKLGKEGTTGASTGNHLHFEVKTPEGKFLDPAPFLKGGATVANKTNPDGSADPSSLETKSDSNASLSAAETKAKDDCPPSSGPSAPDDPSNPNPTDPIPNDPGNTTGGQTGAGMDKKGTSLSSRQIFEKAWTETMKHEVGPWWGTAPQYSPGDPELDAGLINTEEQRKKVGLKGWSPGLGGTTKFGITTASGVKTPIKDLTYEQAKSVGFKNYWESPSSIVKPGSIAEKNPYVAIMMYDILFMSWSGAKHIWQQHNVGNLQMLTKGEQLALNRQISISHLNYLKSISKDKPKNPMNGWETRLNNRQRWIEGLNL